jgi:hypothetical protein
MNERPIRNNDFVPDKSAPRKQPVNAMKPDAGMSPEFRAELRKLTRPRPTVKGMKRK